MILHVIQEALTNKTGYRKPSSSSLAFLNAGFKYPFNHHVYHINLIRSECSARGCIQNRRGVSINLHPPLSFGIEPRLLSSCFHLDTFTIPLFLMSLHLPTTGAFSSPFPRLGCHVVSSLLPASALPQVEVTRLPPFPAEDEARVGGREEDDDDRHHGAIEDHEGDLVVSEAAVEAAAQLGDTEGAADQDCDGGDCDGCCSKISDNWWDKKGMFMLRMDGWLGREGRRKQELTHRIRRIEICWIVGRKGCWG